MPAIAGVESSRHGGRGRQQIGYPTRTSESTPSVTIEELPPSDDEDQDRKTPLTSSIPTASSSRRTPYSKEKKPKSKRVKKY